MPFFDFHFPTDLVATPPIKVSVHHHLTSFQETDDTTDHDEHTGVDSPFDIHGKESKEKKKCLDDPIRNSDCSPKKDGTEGTIRKPIRNIAEDNDLATFVKIPKKKNVDDDLPEYEWDTADDKFELPTVDEKPSISKVLYTKREAEYEKLYEEPVKEDSKIGKEIAKRHNPDIYKFMPHIFPKDDVVNPALASHSKPLMGAGKQEIYNINLVTPPDGGTQADVYLNICGRRGCTKPFLLNNRIRDDSNADFRVIAPDVGRIVKMELGLACNARGHSSFHPEMLTIGKSEQREKFRIDETLACDLTPKLTRYTTDVNVKQKSRLLENKDNLSGTQSSMQINMTENEIKIAKKRKHLAQHLKEKYKKESEDFLNMN